MDAVNQKVDVQEVHLALEKAHYRWAMSEHQYAALARGMKAEIVVSPVVDQMIFEFHRHIYFNPGEEIRVPASLRSHLWEALRKKLPRWISWRLPYPEYRTYQAREYMPFLLPEQQSDRPPVFMELLP